jgi:integrase
MADTILPQESGVRTHKLGSKRTEVTAEALQLKDWKSDTEIALLVQTPGKYRIGPRVTLVCDKPGRGAAELRYMRDGRTRWMGLGGWPEVSVAEMRRKAEAAIELRTQGIDPLEKKAADKRAAAVAAAKAMTFGQVTARFLTVRESGWRNPKHRQQWRNTLTTYATPINDLPVSEIDTPAVLSVLTPIWTTKPETGSRVAGRIEAILDYAGVQGWRDRNMANPARWKGNLEWALPAKSKVRKVKHHAALPYRELPAFMRVLDTRQGIAGLALRFLILTAARSGEVRLARWSEIDLKAKVWVIPEGRMKAERQHRVPLSAAAIAVLRDAEQLRNAKDGLLFEGMKQNNPLSDMTLGAVLRRLGRADLTVHGFRSTFRDWCAESNYSREVAEAALAHVQGDKTEAAYFRSDLFDQRRKLMDAWARFCSSKA